MCPSTYSNDAFYANSPSPELMYKLLCEQCVCQDTSDFRLCLHRHKYCCTFCVSPIVPSHCNYIYLRHYMYADAKRLNSNTSPDAKRFKTTVHCLQIHTLIEYILQCIVQHLLGLLWKCYYQTSGPWCRW